MTSLPPDLSAAESLRSSFFAKDRAIILPANAFLQAPEIATPGSPAPGNRRIYLKSDGWYGLQSDGTETKFAQYQAAISAFQNIPGLVGFWSMSSVQRSTGNAYDLSGQGRTLTYNGNPTYNIYNDIVPYINLDGTGDYLSRPDETDLDILGTETHNATAVQGLTFGGWFRPSVLTGLMDFMGKGDNSTAAGSSYFFEWRADLAGDPIQFWVSSGVGFFNATITPSPAINNWYWIVARYTPSTELKIFFDETSAINTTAIPASLANSAAPFTIGNLGAPLNRYFFGDATFCFLSANALPDSYIAGLRNISKGLFV